MKRTIVAVLLCALVGPPAWAQEARSEVAERAGVPAAGSQLDLQAIVHQKALEIAAFQVPQVPQTPAPTSPRASGPEKSGKTKVIYLATLAGAVAGTIYNISTTRDALDHHLRARTFPMVWKETNKPEDKGSVSGIIAGANGGLMAIGALVYAKGNAPLGTFINVLVGAGTTVIGLRNRSIINDCLKTTCK